MTEQTVGIDDLITGDVMAGGHQRSVRVQRRLHALISLGRMSWIRALFRLRIPCVGGRCRKRQWMLANPLVQGTMKRRGPAGVVLRKRRATSAIEYQARGHGCGVVVLKTIEQHITAEQDDCQQAISKIGTLAGPLIAHFRWIPVLAHRPLSFLRPS
jgi:hypothetical protein